MTELIMTGPLMAGSSVKGRSVKGLQRAIAMQLNNFYLQIAIERAAPGLFS